MATHVKFDMKSDHNIQILFIKYYLEVNDKHGEGKELYECPTIQRRLDLCINNKLLIA
jgi:hypothetical protein